MQHKIKTIIKHSILSPNLRHIYFGGMKHKFNITLSHLQLKILKTRMNYIIFNRKKIIWHTLSVHNRTTADNSCTTRSTHFNTGSFNWAICFLTIASKAISGVNRPTRIPWILRIANEISRRSSFSSHDILTISKRSLHENIFYDFLFC